MGQGDHLILYVDDDRSNRIVFEHTFSQRFRIETVASGADALAVLGERPVGVVVTDQRMPGMSGNELLERVREAWPETIRIVLTAYSDLDPILRAVNDGLVARYVVKPWHADALTTLLSWAIAAYEVGRDGSALQLRLLETERLATLGTIAAAVLHDVQQPVSHMATNTTRLAELAAAAPALVRAAAQVSEPERGQLLELAGELPELADDLARGARTVSEILAGMTRLLDAAKGSQVEPAEPTAVIRYAISVCRRLVTASRSSIEYRGPEQLAMVRLGSGQLAQVLINIIANAAQALASTSRRGAIRIAAVETPRAVEITIVDDGPGMSGDTLARAGTPLFTTRPGGTGLGLSQCRRLLEGSGGSLRIESLAEHGTSVVCIVARTG